MLKYIKYQNLRLYNEYLSTAKKIQKYYKLFAAKFGDKFAVKFKVLFQHFSQILRNAKIHFSQEKRRTSEVSN